MSGERARACLSGAALAASVFLVAAAGHGQSCLTGARTTENATPTKVEYHFDSAGHAVRATGVTWLNIDKHAIDVEGGQAACFSGGTVDGPYPEDAVYECSAEHCPNGQCPSPCWPYHLSAGLSMQVAAPTVVEDVRISDYGDGISQEQDANRANLEIRRVYLHDIHDDAVENDWGASVKVIDSLFERVNIGFASRQRSGENIDARDRTFEVRNSLILLHRFTNQYKNKYGHGGFWKWGHDGMDPRFAVTDNVFVAEFPSGLIFPLVDQVVECRNNKLLWVGSLADWEDLLDSDDDSDGLDTRGRLEALSHCYTVILKPASQTKAAFLAQHWDPLVAQWKSTHVAAGGTPGAAPTSAPTPDPDPTPDPTPDPGPVPDPDPAPDPDPDPAPDPDPTAAPTPGPAPAPTAGSPPIEPILLP